MTLYYVAARDEDGTFIDETLPQKEAQQFVRQHRQGLLEWREVKG